MKLRSENLLIQDTSDEVVPKTSNLKGAMIPESRMPTFLPNQEDHVTPYGLIKRAITLHAENFLKLDNQMRELIKSGSSDLEELSKKQNYRDGMIRILLAVSMFNDDITESATPMSNTTIFSPPSVKRRDNLRSADTIDQIIENYKVVADRYTNSMSHIDFIEVNGLEGVRLNSFKEDIKKAFESDLSKAKEDFISNLARSALINFNNISGITYDHKEIEVCYPSGDSGKVDLSASKMITDKSYFDYSAVDKDIKPDAGDSVFVVQLLKILEQSFVSENNIIEVDDTTKIAGIFANSFFLPCLKGYSLPRTETFNLEKTTSRQYSVNELEHHMARHLFLIKSCFPSLERKAFKNKITRAGDRKVYDFDCLISDFVYENTERHLISKKESKEVLVNVKAYLRGFEEKMSSYDDKKISATPFHSSELSAVEVDERKSSFETKSNQTPKGLDLNSVFNDSLNNYNGDRTPEGLEFNDASNNYNAASKITYAPVKRGRTKPDEQSMEEGEPSTSRSKPQTNVSQADVVSINTDIKTR